MIEDTRDGVTILGFECLGTEASLRHIVTTRRAADGGEFRPDLRRTEDRRHLAQLLGVPERPVVFANQVHGDRVLVVNADTGDGCAGDADALVTSDPRIALAVRGADCPTVLLIDPDRPALALVHSGWRGTVAHIVSKAVARLVDHLDSHPSRLSAGIAPSVGPCCYEVGEEVAAHFEVDFPAAVVRRQPGKLFVDLAAAIRDDLRAAGIPPDRIETSRLCTSCRSDLLYSFRREGNHAGRSILAACLE